MSEDPKGFDAGDYNLFRYCHNDPLDRVDPMGLGDEQVNAQMVKVGYVQPAMHVGSHIPTRTFVQTGWLRLDAALVEGKTQGGLTMGIERVSKGNEPPKLDRQVVSELRKYTNQSGIYTKDHNGVPTGFNLYRMPDGSINPQQAIKTVEVDHGIMGKSFEEHYGKAPKGGTFIGNAHWHPTGDRMINPNKGASFSRQDIITGKSGPVMHNNPRSGYDIYQRGWIWHLYPNDSLSGPAPY
jgi:hypothetical protein